MKETSRLFALQSLIFVFALSFALIGALAITTAAGQPFTSALFLTTSESVRQVYNRSYQAIWCGAKIVAFAENGTSNIGASRSTISFLNIVSGDKWKQSLSGERILLACDAGGSSIISLEPAGPFTGTLRSENFLTNEQLTLASESQLLAASENLDKLIVAASSSEQIRLADLTIFDRHTDRATNVRRVLDWFPDWSGEVLVHSAHVSPDARFITLIVSSTDNLNSSTLTVAQAKLGIVDLVSGSSMVHELEPYGPQWTAPFIAGVHDGKLLLGGWLSDRSFQFTKCDLSNPPLRVINCSPSATVFQRSGASIDDVPIVTQRLVIGRGTERCAYLVSVKSPESEKYGEAHCISILGPTHIGADPGFTVALAPDGNSLAILGEMLGERSLPGAGSIFANQNFWLVYPTDKFAEALQKK